MAVAPVHDPAEFAFPLAGTRECPFPFYEAVRNAAGVYQLPGREEYVISRWKDLVFVAQNPQIFSNAPRADELGFTQRPFAEGPSVGLTPWSAARSDPPEHAVKRLAGRKLFAPDRIRDYEPMVRRIVDELIDGFAPRGAVDLPAEFSRLLPLHVTCEVLGLPRADAPLFLRWTEHDEFQGSRFLSAERIASQRELGAEAVAYLRAVIVERYERPGDDALSGIVADQVARDGAPDFGYLVAEAHGFLAAGLLTTSHMLTNTMNLLLDNADVMDRVRGDLSLVRDLLEESLRLETPTQWSVRAVLQDVEMAGTLIPAGSVVIAIWAAGNRDPATFDQPDCVSLDREPMPKSHLAFGRGPHRCVGAPLALLEGRIAYERLLTRLHDIRLAPGRNDFAHMDSVIMRTLQHLYLEFEAR